MRFAPCVAALTALVAASPPAADAAGTAQGERAAPHRAAPAASPSPTPAPAGGDDPCGGPMRLLATLNRPTIGYSACVVPPGAVVLEEGYQSASLGGQSPSVLAQYPQGFERIGLTSRLEVDIVGPNFNRLRGANGVSAGYSDMGLGIKYEFTPKTRFTYAFDALLTGATGGAAYTSGSASETLNLDVAYQASRAVGLGITLGGLATGGPAAGQASAAPRYQRYGAFFPSLVVTTQVPGGTQFYAELVGETRTSAAPGGRTLLDFGIQKLLGPYFEIDAEYGAVFAPTDTRANYFGIGTGIRVK